MKYNTIIIHNTPDNNIQELLPNLKNTETILVAINVQKDGDPVPESHGSMQSVIFTHTNEKDAYEIALQHCNATYNNIRFDANIDKGLIIKKIITDFPELLI